MRTNASLKDILEDFSPAANTVTARARRPVTIWLSPEDKARYDRLQDMSGRGFSKKLREIFRAALDVAEDRTASPASAPIKTA